MFLDAGGVLVHPNWARVAAALAARGVATTPHALTAAEPHAKREMDLATLMARTDDRQRGWIYFESVLRHAGLDAPTTASERALAEVRAYHDVHNVWEHVPDDVVPALAGAARARRAAGGGLERQRRGCDTMFDPRRPDAWFDVILDSHHFGVEKPDPAPLRPGAGRERRRRRATVHVGDFFHIDVVGARAAGLADAVLFDVAALYDDVDCPRVHRLSELAGLVERADARTNVGRRSSAELQLRRCGGSDEARRRCRRPSERA